LITTPVITNAPLRAIGDDAPSVNEKVLQYAKDHVGEKVGNGQCTALAFEALRFAGAKRFPPSGDDADYVWGKRLASLKEAKPGDVLQFRDAVFKGKGRLPDGRRGSWRQWFPHHTAIVSGSKNGGKVLLIIHQNFVASNKSEKSEKKDDAEKYTVQEGAITLSELQPGGWVRAYRPVSIDDPDEPAGEPE
jgi:hypothetical protein